MSAIEFFFDQNGDAWLAVRHLESGARLAMQVRRDSPIEEMLQFIIAGLSLWLEEYSDASK